MFLHAHRGSLPFAKDGCFASDSTPYGYCTDRQFMCDHFSRVLQALRREEELRRKREEDERRRAEELAALRAKNKYLKKGHGKLANDERLRVDLEKVAFDSLQSNECSCPCVCQAVAMGAVRDCPRCAPAMRQLLQSACRVNRAVCNARRCCKSVCGTSRM